MSGETVEGESVTNRSVAWAADIGAFSAGGYWPVEGAVGPWPYEEERFGAPVSPQPSWRMTGGHGLSALRMWLEPGLASRKVIDGTYERDAPLDTLGVFALWLEPFKYLGDTRPVQAPANAERLAFASGRHGRDDDQWWPYPTSPENGPYTGPDGELWLDGEPYAVDDFVGHVGAPASVWESWGLDPSKHSQFRVFGYECDQTLSATTAVWREVVPAEWPYPDMQRRMDATEVYDTVRRVEEHNVRANLRIVFRAEGYPE